MRSTNRAMRRAVVLSIFLLSVTALARGQAPALHDVTLFSRAGHHEADLGKSAYSFYALARSDNFPSPMRHKANLYYGSYAFSDGSDWFSVSAGGPELTRIKDLGAKTWSDMVSTPFVPVTPHSTEGIRAANRGESFEESSEGRVTKVALGHVYVIHVKGDEEDYYVMLRVDDLAPSDRCTISWRVVPPPEQSW